MTQLSAWLARLPGNADITQPLIAVGIALLLYAIAHSAARLLAPAAASGKTAENGLEDIAEIGEIAAGMAASAPAARGGLARNADDARLLARRAPARRHAAAQLAAARQSNQVRRGGPARVDRAERGLEIQGRDS